jgi:hypothetical protein
MKKSITGDTNIKHTDVFRKGSAVMGIKKPRETWNENDLYRAEQERY